MDTAHMLQALAQATVMLIGLYNSILVAFAAVKFVWRQYLRPPKALSSFGEWAVVTGATDGIGRAYCNVLAAQGMKMYLVSRDEGKLRNAATEIEHQYLVETKYFVADLVAAGAPSHDGSCWYGLKANLDGLDVGVLINNAGMSYRMPDFLAEVDSTTVASIVSINCSAIARMAQVVLPGMVRRKRGCIVNISSGTAFLPTCPLLSVYSATKAWVINFSRSLAVEYAGHGISVQAQAPNFVTTKLSKIKKPSVLVPTPATWASAARRHLGYEQLAVPYPPHAMQTAALRSVPEIILTPVLLKMHKQIRSKALKKLAAAKKE